MWWIGITAASGSLLRAPWGHHINPRSISGTFSVVLNGFATSTGHLDSMLLRASQATMYPSSPFNKSACKRTLHPGMASGMLQVLCAQPQPPADMRRRYASCMAAMPGSRTGLRLSSPSRRSHVLWYHPLQLKCARNSGIAHYSEEAAKRVHLEDSLKERFDAQRLLEAIVYEVDTGCLNAQGKARFSNVLRAQLEAWLSYIDSPSFDGGRTETIVSLLAEARRYAAVMPLQRRALLDKIAKLLGYETAVDTSAQTNAADGSAIVGASTIRHASVKTEFSAAVTIPAQEQLTPSSMAVPVNPNNLVQRSADASMSDPANASQDALWSAQDPIASTAREMSANPDSPPVAGAGPSSSSSQSASPPGMSNGEAWSNRLARHHPAITFGYSEPVNLRWVPSVINKATVMKIDTIDEWEEMATSLSSVATAVEVLEEKEEEKSERHEMVVALEQVGGDVAKMEERTSVSIRAKRKSAVAEARKAKRRGDAPRMVEVEGGGRFG